MLMICAVEARHAAERAGADPVAQLKAAMSATVNHWMVLDEDTQFRGAIAGVLMLAKDRGDDDTRVRIEREVKLLRGLAVATSGVPVNFTALLGEEGDEKPEPFGLSKMWRDLKAAIR